MSKTYSIIGSGNVATQLAKALSQQGAHINGVFSRNKEHAEALAHAVNAGSATDNLGSIPHADVYVFALKDDVLASTINAFLQWHEPAGSLFIHTAGCVDIGVFPKHLKAAVLYPLQTISKSHDIDFSHVPLFIEGNCDATLAEVRDIANCISSVVTELSSEKRRVLHLAAVFANNFTNHCCTLAYELLKQNGIAPSCLTAIIDETANKLHHLPPTEAQTGPAVRWDEKIMAKHTELLQNNKELLAIYELMSQSIHKRKQL